MSDILFMNRKEFSMKEIDDWILNKIDIAPDNFFRDISIKAYHYLSDFEKIDLYIKYRGDNEI